MIVKTQGIVLNHINYGERSIIVKWYAKDHGYQGSVINGVRKAKPLRGMGMGYFQPFTVLDMVVYMKPSRNLNRISEFKSILTWYAEDIKRQSILLFLAEVINKLLRTEHTENTALFNYLLKGLYHFKTAQSVENFHLQYLLKMTSYLGITVLSGMKLFENMNIMASQNDIEDIIDQLLEVPFENKVTASGSLRFRVLEVLMYYFQYHVPGFGEIHSLKVLRQIFQE